MSAVKRYFGDKSGADITSVTFAILSSAAILVYYVVKFKKENTALKEQLASMKTAYAAEKQQSEQEIIKDL